MGEALGTDMDMGYLLPAFTAGSSPPILSLCNIQHHISLSSLLAAGIVLSLVCVRSINSVVHPRRSPQEISFSFAQSKGSLSLPTVEEDQESGKRRYAILFLHSSELRFDIASSYVSMSLSDPLVATLAPLPLAVDVDLARSP